ncbi:hypothetical protein BDV96DRAFT_651869 [Lophiotrema nucula]|uniref:C2H2-type domain-containing protein n=1 Tax=Lophiotrema nucula TaxID=690887 RepID=A0A6A5YRS2_9PLEO|nr:hypothetical protein BDV96DRAFT_651869 [Lophiotrema nucula]
MAGLYQFDDLPQIHMPDETPFPGWPNDYIGHINPSRQDRTRTITLHGEDMDFDGLRNYSRSTMEPMQRFLQGVDRPPFATGFIHPKLDYMMAQSTQPFRQYEQPWPAVDYMAYSPRDGSPDRTSNSDNSSHSAHTELRSPNSAHIMPCRSPDSLLSPYAHDNQANAFSPFPIADLQRGGTYKSDLTTTSIDPRDLEYDHQPEPIAEEQDHGDMKPEYEYDHEPVYQVHDQRVDSVSEVYQTAYPDPARARDPESVQPIGTEGDSSDSDYKPSSNKANKKRRSSASSSGSGRQRRRSSGRKLSNTPASGASTKIGKRTRGSNPSASAAKGAAAKADEGDERPFPCPMAQYGCQSTFSSKNEWKRHVFTQHVKLGFWRCDLCATTVDPADDRTVYHNDFNRKDLFCQHLRRMHAAPKAGSYTSSKHPKEYPVTEDNLAEHTQRCYQTLRPAPQQSSCLFCNHNFKGPQSFEERMEHVGRHLEKERKTNVVPNNPAEWRHDPALEQYLVEEGLIAHDRNNGWKIGDGKPRRFHGGYDDGESEADD